MSCALPQVVYGGALSQPERPFGVPEAIPEGRQYSLSQHQPYDPDTDMYSSPIDQLPPWQKPQVIFSRGGKRGGGGGGQPAMARKGSSRSVSQFRGPPVISEEAAGGEGEVYREVGAVISGLAEFKSELLQLHALVCVCTEWQEAFHYPRFPSPSVVA